MNRAKLRFSMLSAGRGSNFEAIMQHVAANELNAECISLITPAGSKAIEVANKYGVPVRIIEGDNLFYVLQSENPDLVAMSGYMRKIPENILERFENKIINIHPALLPSFGGNGCYGIHVHEKVIQAGVKITGVTVHFVNKDYDAGKIIAQNAVPVLPNDTPETLAKRVLQEEHNIYWQVIRDIAFMNNSTIGAATL
ncbi:MAG: phosphoribosylglycinamide formyltransferase [Fibromonadales bacterium]|nr:phosphoribosylglycinamide formyltransferase [Fibromonadales bacterium]